MVSPYSSEFYQQIGTGSRRSAQAMLPLVLQWVQPRSVVDVGCGIGAWLAVARAGGVTEILGLDGAYVDMRQLQIPRAQFLPADLSKPPALAQRFELVLSLEVAEHLPPEAAAGLIAYLTSLGPVVLFSAAVPHQYGDHHLNEQWPEYWAALFAAHGFCAVDCLRARFWHDPEVEFWYAQNTLLYVQEAHPVLARLQAEGYPPVAQPLPLVHPQLFLRQQGWLAYAQARAFEQRSLREVLAGLPALLRRAVQNRLPRTPSALCPPTDKPNLS
jgi:SAM-dependent methyltransferase